MTQLLVRAAHPRSISTASLLMHTPHLVCVSGGGGGLASFQRAASFQCKALQIAFANIKPSKNANSALPNGTISSQGDTKLIAAPRNLRCNMI